MNIHLPAIWIFFGLHQMPGFFWPIAKQKYLHRWGKNANQLYSHSQGDGKDWTSKSHEIPAHLMIDVLASIWGRRYLYGGFLKCLGTPKLLVSMRKRKVSWLGWLGGTPETIGNPHILVELAIFIFDENYLSGLLIVRVATSMASIWIILVMWLLISSRAHPQQSHLIVLRSSVLKGLDGHANSKFQMA